MGGVSPQEQCQRTLFAATAPTYLYIMPTYTYRCEGCDHLWDEQRKIVDRKIPTTEPCPHCACDPLEAGPVVLEPAAPGFGDAYKIGVKKLPNWWGERLQRIKDNNRGSTVSADRATRQV